MPRFTLLLLAALLNGLPSNAQTGTFLDRWDAGDLRLASYNVYRDSNFQPNDSADAETPARFARIAAALQPDIFALQEIYDHSAVEVAALLDNVAPLDVGNWHAYRSSDNVIASRYPLLGTAEAGGHADALIDLPDDRFDVDFYIVNDHLACCSNETRRQEEADEIVRWLDGVRNTGGPAGVPAGTPFAVVGDFNIVGSGQPLETLITGDIVNASIGADSPPDWDGTPITDANPRHNATLDDDYTWRVDSSPFDPGVLDYVLFSDSVLETANRFVLNTTEMASAELAATGLQANDVMIGVADGRFDHLPLVVDFRVRQPTLVGDINGDGSVDLLDLDILGANFGAFSPPPGPGSGDLNGDGNIDLLDLDILGANFGTTSATTVPEPAGVVLLLAAIAVASRHRWQA